MRSSLAKEPQVPGTGRTEEMKMQEEDDLQLAIAMSLNEQDNKVHVYKTTRYMCTRQHDINTTVHVTYVQLYKQTKYLVHLYDNKTT